MGNDKMYTYKEIQMACELLLIEVRWIYSVIICYGQLISGNIHFCNILQRSVIGAHGLYVIFVLYFILEICIIYCICRVMYQLFE